VRSNVVVQIRPVMSVIVFTQAKQTRGKGDKPRQVTKQYEENYTEIFPNAFKPKWQTELEKQQPTKSN
jgi:hypothetical protein